MARLWLLLALLWTALPALAQDRATLVADRVELVSTSILVASGKVEVFFKDQSLTASRITYDASTDRLQIEGPILLTDDTGNTVTAEMADLSADLTEGLLTSARLMLADQLQMTAQRMERRDGGRITRMTRVAASSCKVFGNGPPLWEIRAASVTHDSLSQSIRFRDASLRFAGVPVLYLPWLRVPDPTVSRATGFLMPELRSSTALGTGVTLPYFITLGPSRDLTLRPFLTNTGGRTLGFRFRQAYDAGLATLEGAVSRDDRLGGSSRGYVRVDADFALGDWSLGIEGTTVSDAAYLQDYGISDSDRLVSTISLGRVARDRLTDIRLTFLRTLRETESNATQPSALAEVESLRRMDLGGGVLSLESSFAAARRNASSGADSDGDGIADGRDMARISTAADWHRRWVSRGGLVLDAGLQAGADLYAIDEDDLFQGRAARGQGRGGLRLSLPLVRRDAGGVTLFEPALQLSRGWSDASGPVPDEDSALVEFDEGNLFALDRFPGADAVETGGRAAIGANLTRQSLGGDVYGLTLGRVFQLEGGGLYAQAGTAEQAADWLVAGHLSLARGGATWSTTTRALFAEDLSLSRLESRFAVSSPRASLAGGYEFLPADPSRGRDTEAREIVVTGTAQLGNYWSLTGSDRYDLSSKTTRASLALAFRNDCLAVDLSVSRRFTSSSIVEPSSEFGLTVELLGLGGTTAGRKAATCR